MSAPHQESTARSRSIWLGIAVGWLTQLALKTILPIVVLVGIRYFSLATENQALWLAYSGDTSHPIWYALQAAVFIGSVIAGGLAGMLAPRRSLALSIALVLLSLLTTAFEQFPRPLSNIVTLIWTGGPCIGLVVGVLLAASLTRGDVDRAGDPP
jgi:hypothetical protein